MAMSIKLAICLALLLTLGGAKKSCEVRAAKFEKNCLAKGYVPRTLLNCVSGEGKAMRAKRCARQEKKLVKKCRDYKCEVTDNSDKKWRDDMKCGKSYPLPDGTASECDPDGFSPCCDRGRGACGNGEYYCNCTTCVDYRVAVKKVTEFEDSTSPSPSTLCDDKCNARFGRFVQRYCEDESECNGYTYGVWCSNVVGEFTYAGVPGICNGYASCDNGEDERDCEVTEYSTQRTCTHYRTKVLYEVNVTVPILNYTRCSVFSYPQDGNIPYCTDYTDQTNCSDPERVGGTCNVNGYHSSVSKYMVCYGYDTRTNTPVQLCDDNIENNCATLSGHCTVHKHKFCDGVYDCPDGSDEVHDTCSFLTTKTCARRFNNDTELKMPLSWIMDGIKDCRNGLDEDLESGLA